MLLVLGLLFIVVPIVELYVIIQVSHVIGGLETLALLIVESLLGAWVMKWQGLGALDRISRAIEQHRMPARELVDGFLILLAGALMVTPGFVTDIFGFLLLLPPTRSLVRGVLMRRFRQGRYGRVFAAGASRGPRFVGSFRPGVNRRDVLDTDGRDRASHPDAEGSDRPELRG